jgi:urease gamma subunit
MEKLLVQKLSSCTAFQKSLAALGIRLLKISLVVNELPRTAKRRGKRFPVLMFMQSPTQIAREADVKPGIPERVQNIHVEHSRTPSQINRVRRSLLRGLTQSKYVCSVRYE